MKHQDAETMNHVPLNINITNPGATQHELHPRKSKRRTIDRNHNTIGLRRLVVLATIAHAMGMAAIGVEGMNNGSSSSSSSSSLASLRGSVGSTTTTTTTPTARKLNFREKSNLFDHETTTNLESVSQSETIETFDEEIDRDSGIGAPPDNSELSLPVDRSTDDSNMDESGIIDPSMRYPHDSAQQLLEQEEQKQKQEQDSPSSTSTKNDETAGQQQQQQQQTQLGFFDGFEIETTSQQEQQPTQEGYFDGFEITKTPPNTSDKNIGKVASSYAKRTQDQSNTFNVDLDNHETTISSNTNTNNSSNNNRIPHKDVFIFVGLALLSVLLYLVYWRDSILHERIERADENNAKIDRLKNLYEDLDKYSTHMLDDCTLSLSPDHSPTNKNNKTLGKITFSKSMMTRDVDNDSDDGIRNKKSNDNVEHVDFSDDIEFGEESSSQYDDDHPELMMRMVRRNSFQKQHWVKYSSDEFTIDGAEEFFSDDDSLSASERR